MDDKGCSLCTEFHACKGVWIEDCKGPHLDGCRVPVECRWRDTCGDFEECAEDCPGLSLGDGMMVDAALFSSECDEWGTPRPLYDRLSQMFGPFDLDPCTSPDNPLGTPRFYTKEDDGLKQIWSAGGTHDNPIKVYMNPPYGRGVGDWIHKAWHAALFNRALVVCLLPSRTDTRWWHNYAMSAKSIYFIKGRLTFEGAKNTAPFPSVVLVFSGHNRNPSVFSLEVPK